MKTCLNCGQPLTSTRAKFCGDTCRKRHSRNSDKADTKTPDLRSGNEATNIFGLFSSELSELGQGGKIALRQVLTNQAKYQDVLVSRAIENAHWSPDTLKAEQLIQSVFWRLVDDLG